MKGIEHYTSAAGFRVIRVHYSADLDRDPDTPAGAAWMVRESAGIPGGINSAHWRREQEIDWEAGGGELCFPQMTQYKDKIVIPPFTIPETWDVYGSYDYGHRNPACFLVMALDHDGCPWILWEMYGSGMGYKEQARLIRACPYFDRLTILPIADPSIWAETSHQQDDNETKSVAQLFFELPEAMRIVFMRGRKGGDITVAERIRSDLWNPQSLAAGGEPALKIFACCTNTIKEFKNLRYEDWSAAMMQNRNVRESIVDKNNHAWDSLKMWMTQFFMAPGRPAEETALDALKKTDPMSWQEWQSVNKLYFQPAHTGTMGQFD